MTFSLRDGSPPSQSNRIAEMFRRIVPPLAALLLARLWLLQFAPDLELGAQPRSPWAHWDSGHYLSIARGGYELSACPNEPGYDSSQHCGNAAWLPGYPFLVGALIGVLGTKEQVAPLLAACFAFGCLALLWNLFLDAELSGIALLTLLLAAFFPGHYYQHAVFPVSMCTFFNLLALQAYSRKHFLWAGFAGAISAFTYSSGIFLCLVLTLHLLIDQRHQPWRTQLKHLLQTSGVSSLGVLAFLGVLQLQTGTWRAYFLVQAKYGYDPTWPWQSITRYAESASIVGPGFIGIQTCFVAVLAPLLVLAACRRPRTTVDEILALFLIVYWLVPLALGGKLSIYRAESMLLPAVALGRKLPAAVLAPVLGVALIVSAGMSLLFFDNVLI